MLLAASHNFSERIHVEGCQHRYPEQQENSLTWPVKLLPVGSIVMLHKQWHQSQQGRGSSRFKCNYASCDPAVGIFQLSYLVRTLPVIDQQLQKINKHLCQTVQTEFINNAKRFVFSAGLVYGVNMNFLPKDQDGEQSAQSHWSRVCFRTQTQPAPTASKWQQVFGIIALCINLSLLKKIISYWFVVVCLKNKKVSSSFQLQKM